MRPPCTRASIRTAWADTLHAFISATSGDLGTVRELVKEGLLTMHCLPVEQANFTPDYHEVAAMLEERIRGCEAVIHLVGLRYVAAARLVGPVVGSERESNNVCEKLTFQASAP